MSGLLEPCVRDLIPLGFPLNCILNHVFGNGFGVDLSLFAHFSFLFHEGTAVQFEQLETLFEFPDSFSFRRGLLLSKWRHGNASVVTGVVNRVLVGIAVGYIEVFLVI